MKRIRFRKKLQHAAVYYTVRAGITILGAVPTWMIRISARCLGALAFGVARREQAIAVAQLCDRTAIGARPERALKLIRGVFNHLGLSVIELCRLMRNTNNRPAVCIPPASRRALDDALGMGRGVVYVTGHIGNWELMAIALAQEGYPIHTVAKNSYDDRFTQLLSSVRARFGVHAIYRESEGSTKKMLRVLRKGGILGMLIDQDTRVNSVFVPFFGADAHTPVGAAAFAIRTGTPVVVGTIKRTVRGSHRLEIAQLSLPNDVVEATSLLTGELEARIRGQMSQWVWFHQRWKTQRPAA